MIVAWSSMASAQERAPTNNLDVVQRLASDIGRTVSQRLGRTDTVRFRFHPQELAWYVVSGVRTGFSDRGFPTITDGNAETTGEFSLHDLSIRYEEPRGDAVFGERVVDRLVVLSLDVTVIRQGTTLISNERFSETARDTVRMDDIERIENVLIPASKGAMESDGFFSTILEPVALIGAIGVAVFLLFHVRS